MISEQSSSSTDDIKIVVGDITLTPEQASQLSREELIEANTALWVNIGKVALELINYQRIYEEQAAHIALLEQEVSLNEDLSARVELYDEETERLHDRMYRDRRTGLKNVAYFEDRILPKLEAKLENYKHLPEALQEKAPVHILFFLDMNGLKQVNDTEGYEIGNSVIFQFTSRILSAVRDSDSVIRWGGDEVIIISEVLPSEYEIATTVLPRRIATKLSRFDPRQGERAITAALGYGKIEDYSSVEEAVEAISELMKINKRQQKLAKLDRAPANTLPE